MKNDKVKQTPKKTESKKETPKKKENIEIEENFLDEEDDKRVIIFIAIALLVIIGTIIGLLVGCEKEIQEEEKPNNQDVVIPVEEDKKEETEKSKKVRRISTVKNTKETSNYEITFYYNDLEDTYTKNIKEGNKVSKYVPEGYTNCKYYTDSKFTKEFDFNTKIKESKNIYLSCELVEYKITYSMASSNPTTYTILDGNITLEDAETNNIFVGWYTDSSYSNKVTKLSKSIIKYAKNNEIKLYAKVVEHLNVNYYNAEGEFKNHDEVTKDTMNSYTIRSGSGYCTNGGKFLGWTTSKGNSRIKYNESKIVSVTDDLSLYAVCGAAKVVYESENNVIEEVGYTEAELAAYELPTPKDLGMETPTYYVKVTEKTSRSKTIVENEKEDIADTEVKLEDVINKAAEGYNPIVGDDVEELEKVFDGWTTELPDPENEENMITVDVPEDFVPEEETHLKAKWVEQPQEEPEIEETSEEPTEIIEG